MIVSYCRTEEDAIAAMRARAKEGLRVAAISALGCPPGTFRMTFLPESSFTDGKTAQQIIDDHDYGKEPERRPDVIDDEGMLG